MRGREGGSDPADPECQVQALLDARDRAVDGLAGGRRVERQERRAGLPRTVHGAVYGAGQTGSPFLPLDTSTAGQAIDSAVARIQQGLNLTFGIGGVATTLSPSHDTLCGAASLPAPPSHG